jgi:hypothetical protein
MGLLHQNMYTVYSELNESTGVPRGGVWGVQTPPKLFQSFDKGKPNSQFRGKYILRT